MVYTLLDWTSTKNKPNYDYFKKSEIFTYFFLLGAHSKIID